MVKGNLEYEHKSMANELADEKYVRLTTFTRDGRRKDTPVWIAHWSDKLMGTTTDDDSWKVKRVRGTQRIEVAPSDSRGKVLDGIEAAAGTAAIVAASDPRYADLELAFIEKYGFQYRLFRLIRKIRGKTPCGISISVA